MGCSMSRFFKATVTLVILVLLFMPSSIAAAATSFDASRSQHLPLPGQLLRGPESVAFDTQCHGP